MVVLPSELFTDLILFSGVYVYSVNPLCDETFLTLASVKDPPPLLHPVNIAEAMIRAENITFFMTDFLFIFLNKRARIRKKNCFEAVLIIFFVTEIAYISIEMTNTLHNCTCCCCFGHMGEVCFSE